MILVMPLSTPPGYSFTSDRVSVKSLTNLRYTILRGKQVASSARGASNVLSFPRRVPPTRRLFFPECRYPCDSRLRGAA